MFVAWFSLHCPNRTTLTYIIFHACLSCSNSRRSKSKSGSRRKSESSLELAFPPQLKETLNRLYHLRRGPLISPGPMRSMDDRAEIRGLFLRFPLEDCLKMMRPTVLSTGSMNGISSAWDNMVSFPAETLSLWDDVSIHY